MKKRLIQKIKDQVIGVSDFGTSEELESHKKHLLECEPSSEFVEEDHESEEDKKKKKSDARDKIAKATSIKALGAAVLEYLEGEA